MAVEVAEAVDLTSALRHVVEGVEHAIRVDACAVYLVDPVDDHLVLMETDGLDRVAIGQVRLAPGEGLVGLVREQRGPVALDDASEHPRFVHHPVTGETRYHAFLGVPVIHYRKVIGVLAVFRRARRKFGARHETFLVTAGAQIAGALALTIAQSQYRDKSGSAGLTRAAQPPYLEGVAAAPGIAIGVVVAPSPLGTLDAVPDREASDVAVEESAFRDAVTRVQAELYQSSKRMKALLPSEAHALFEVYALLVGDENLASNVISRIQRGQWAPAALRDAIKELSGEFENIEDTRLRARAEDIRAIGHRILSELHVDTREASEYPSRSVLLGDEVSLTRIADVPRERLAGIICLKSSALSHTAVIARALGIPAVMGVGDLPSERLAEHTVVVDGYQGRVFVDPSPAVCREFSRLEREEETLTADLEALRDLPAETPDGFGLPLFLNTGLLTDIGPGLDVAPAGVGLYRSEFPFMLRETFPSEDQQCEIYRHMLEAFAPRKVVMRTLDIGGDKPLVYFPIEESNSLLGWRGLRVTLQHPEIFLTQAKAMLRASIGLNNLELLLPMVTVPSEVREAQALLAQALKDLSEEGCVIQPPPLGVMIEVPVVLFELDGFAPLVDFFSLGTNDLTQYLTAVDRSNPRVASLCDHLDPAVLGAIHQAVTRVHGFDKSVSVCGELAGDPAGALLLVGMGVGHLSVAASALPRVKWAIRSIRRDRCVELLHEALGLPDAAAVRKLVHSVLDEAGLGGLLHAGR